jgi:hypothetical protein
MVRGDGWRISLPAKPRLRSGPASPDAAEYKAVSNYSLDRSPDGGMSLLVFHYREKPPPGDMARAMLAYVDLSEGTTGPIGSADVGGRFGQTAAVSRKSGPGQVTAFVSGNDLFVLGTRNTSVHARILATFGS